MAVKASYSYLLHMQWQQCFFHNVRWLGKWDNSCSVWRCGKIICFALQPTCTYQRKSEGIEVCVREKCFGCIVFILPARFHRPAVALYQRTFIRRRHVTLQHVCYNLTAALCFCFQPLTHVCAKNLATFVSQEAGNRPVLLGLALKDSSIDSIKQMKELIRSCQVW